MPQFDNHNEWCERQHAEIKSSIAKIYTRLGIMETHIASQSKMAGEVNAELKILNKWAVRREGATRALMWVAGIGGTIIMILGLIFKFAES